MIENCTLAFKCTQQWESLADTSKVNIKFCNECKSKVYLITSDAELKHHSALQHCIAFIDRDKINWSEPSPFKQGIKPPRQRYRALEVHRLAHALGFIERAVSEDEARAYLLRVKELAHLGKARGFLTFNDVEPMLVNKELKGQDLYDLVEACNDIGTLLYTCFPMSLGVPSFSGS